MSRRPREPRKRGRRAAGRQPSGRGADRGPVRSRGLLNWNIPRSTAISLIAAMAVAMAFAGWLSNRFREAPPAQRELPPQALADSLRATMSRGDWTHGLDFARRLARVDPRNSSVIRNLAVMIHNRAVAQTTRFGRPHPALRTSLERVEAEFQIFALLDSAAALARTPDDWARARLWYGQAHERLGLPLDAYQAYAEIRSRQPGFAPVAARLIWVSRLLKDPLTPNPETHRGPERHP